MLQTDPTDLPPQGKSLNHAELDLKKHEYGGQFLSDNITLFDEENSGYQ